MNNDLDKKLNREALVISKEYSGHVAIPTIVLSLLVVLIYSTVLFLFATKHLSPLLTVFFLIGITFASYMPLHEAVHGNISGNNSKLKWLDRLIGYLMAPIIAIPFTSHQKEHFSHHKNTNKDYDPDVHIQNLFRTPKDFYKSTIQIIKTQNTFVMNGDTKAEIILSLGWRVFFVFLQD